MHERTFASTHLDFRNLDRVDEFDSYHRHLSEASLDRHMPRRARCRECAHEALPDSLLCLTCSRPERPFGVNGAELEAYLTSLMTWERLVQSTEIAQREIQIEAITTDYIAQRALQAHVEPEPAADSAPNVTLRRPLRATTLNLSLLSLFGLLSVMSHAPVVDARPVPTMEAWREPHDMRADFGTPLPRAPCNVQPLLYEAPADFGTPLPRAAHNGQPLLYGSPSLGVASLPGYTWSKGALLFALSSTSSGRHRFQTPIVCAVILLACEQFVDTVMHFVGFQPPSTALYGYRFLARQVNRVIPRDTTLFYAGVRRLREMCGAPHELHVEAGRIDLPPSTLRRTVSTLRPSIRPWGSLVDLEVSSLGLISRGGFMTSPRIWAVAAVEGWLEMRVRVK